MFLSYGEDTITDERPTLYAINAAQSEEGSLSCHTCCDTYGGSRFSEGSLHLVRCTGDVFNPYPHGSEKLQVDATGVLS
jgi:hypothetical protein